jgi:hypothetical protein
MKVEFKQACEIEGQKFGPDMRKKPGVFNVPGYFIFIEFFVTLLKANLLKILDVSDEDFQEENVPEKFRAVEPDPIVISIIEDIMMSKEPKEEGEDDEQESSDSSSESNASESSSEGNGTEGEEHGSEEQQSDEVKNEEACCVKSSEGFEDLSEDEKELAFLQEKKLRLTNKEKKRYAELKAKLKVKE